MSDTLDKVRALVLRGVIRISDHGYDEIAEDDIFAGEVLAGVHSAIVVEDYPESERGKRVLVLQKDSKGKPIHVVWGVPNGHDIAVMVTAYRPDPTLWDKDFRKRTP